MCLCVYCRWALPGSRHTSSGFVQQQLWRRVGHQAETQRWQRAVTWRVRKDGWMDRSGNEPKRISDPHSALFLFILRATREKETDGQICQEQSLKTVYDQMNTRCPPPLPFYLSLSASVHPFLFFFYFLSIICLLRYCGAVKLLTWLITSDREPAA